MGFRNVRDFNIALLGKQAWRLIQFPEKLVSQVFKARYFPNGSYLDAQIGSNPSYIWRSILAAQEMIKQGVSCRVGSGETINILNSPWLPSNSDPYIRTQNQSLINQKVAALMRNGERKWDEEVIYDIFSQRDAEMILSIPLDHDNVDNWYWRRDKLGMYTVKGGYLFLQKLKQPVTRDANSGFWRSLWNLKIPPKVKNFLWRASSNCLPTKDMLRIKRVPVDCWCPTCNAHPETAVHTLLTCSFATQCWNLTDHVFILDTIGSFQEWLQGVFDQKMKAETEVIAMISWMLWKNRNDVVWKQKSLDVSSIISAALSVLNQFKFVQDRSFNISLGYMTHEDGSEQWRAPIGDKIKVNSDAAIFDNPDRYSYAFVARNHTGTLIEARSRCKQGPVSPVLAEAMGILEALSWIKSMKLENVDVEADSLELIQWIRSSYTSLSYVGCMVDKCRNLLAGMSSQNVMLRFVKRSANRVAHYLASYSYLPADRSWRVGNVHPKFDFVLCNDLI